jgi:hypothetical protein
MKNKKIKVKLINVARILIIGYIIFLSLFALDTTFGIGLFIHLLPSLIFLITLIIFWKKPKIAGILFVLEGLGTIIVFNTYRDLFVLFVISIIPVLIGLLFFFAKPLKNKN